MGRLAAGLLGGVRVHLVEINGETSVIRECLVGGQSSQAGEP